MTKLSPSTTDDAVPARKPSARIKACASPSGLGCTLYCSERPIVQRALKLLLVMRCYDDHDFANASQNLHQQRVRDHGLVLDRQQMFPHGHRDELKPCARSIGENDANALCRFETPNSAIVLASPARQSVWGMLKVVIVV